MPLSKAESILADKSEHYDVSLDITRLIVNACAEAKASDLSVLDVSEVFDLSDYFVLASGRSDRQVQGIANKVITAMQECGYRPLAVEGFDRGHWILIDFGEHIVHIFYEPLRSHYDIEGLWVKAKKLEVIPGREVIVRKQVAA
ncbi:MAG: ribosome silencing factor [Candidatus Dadabacteria bacterium]|nr:MAG: ribosome silencing factor [Candidatus Dadabacteria bacterium]